MRDEALKLAAEFDKRFTSMNGVDVPERVSVPRDEWRALYAAIKQALAAQPAPVQQEPIYQMQMMDGKWIDQAKQSYEYNKAHGHTVRIVYTTPPAAQPAPVQEPVEFGMYGKKMMFKIGVQQFALDYEPDTQDEFNFMREMLIRAFSTFTNGAKTTPPAAQPASCPHGMVDTCCENPGNCNQSAQPAPVHPDSARIDWLTNNPLDALDIFGHVKGSDAVRWIRQEIDNAMLKKDGATHD